MVGGVTFNDLYLETRRRLRAEGIAAHDLEARLIMSRATGKTREELLQISRRFVTDNAVIQTVNDMVARRLGGEPIAYIVGGWEFYSLPLIIDESVLIPRVDTELLAELAIALLKVREGRCRMLDLCSGSGCIGLAVAANVPDCRVVLSDNSPKALKLSRVNALKNRLTRNVSFIEADALKDPPKLLGMFDLVVSNPPYIPTSDLIGLEPSVRDYEPIHALDGGEDGLDFFRAIAANWKTVINDGGHLAFECGIEQAESLRAIMQENGFSSIKTIADTLGIERVVVGKK